MSASLQNHHEGLSGPVLERFKYDLTGKHVVGLQDALLVSCGGFLKDFFSSLESKVSMFTVVLIAHNSSSAAGS